MAMSITLCDRSFVVMREHRNTPDQHHLLYDACSVNGYAVMEKYDDVVKMIRKAKLGYYGANNAAD